MMCSDGWELLVTPSNMRPVMQSLRTEESQPRYLTFLAKHMFIAKLASETLTAHCGWGRMIKIPRGQVRAESWVSRVSTDQDAAQPVTLQPGPRWLVTRARCGVASPQLTWVMSPVMMQYQAGACISWSQISPAAGHTQPPADSSNPCSMLHVSQIYRGTQWLF